MHTGSATVPMPSLGAWLSYGLGTFNPNLPSYVVLCEHLPYGGSQIWDSSFLPPIHQGVRIVPGRSRSPTCARRRTGRHLHELEQIMLRDVNLCHAESRPGDRDLRARIAIFDVARGMMREAPEALDIRRETSTTLDIVRRSPKATRPRLATSA